MHLLRTVVAIQRTRIAVVTLDLLLYDSISGFIMIFLYLCKTLPLKVQKILAVHRKIQGYLVPLNRSTYYYLLVYLD